MKIETTNPAPYAHSLGNCVNNRICRGGSSQYLVLRTLKYMSRKAENGSS